jgi:hypothetical protein
MKCGIGICSKIEGVGEFLIAYRSSVNSVLNIAHTRRTAWLAYLKNVTL